MMSIEFRNLATLADASQPLLIGIPAATWTAVIVFVLGSILNWVYRILDRKRRSYVERLDSTMRILAELRKQMDIYRNGGAEWDQRSLIESEITRNLLLIKVNRHETQDIQNWVYRVSDAIKYDEQWQDVEIYEKCIAQPLLAWVEEDITRLWFRKRNKSEKFTPTQFDF